MLPTEHGTFQFVIFNNLCPQPYSDQNKLAIAIVGGSLINKNLAQGKLWPKTAKQSHTEEPLPHEHVHVRVHDQCATSEVFGSVKCDCREQLHHALKHINKHSGMVIYMQQEGRGIGLDKKIAAYHAQESLGLDTVDANRFIGAPDEARAYGCVPTILNTFGVKSVALMTNNPYKVKSLKDLGVKISGTISSISNTLGKRAAKYLHTKQQRMGHMNHDRKDVIQGLLGRLAVQEPANQTVTVSREFKSGKALNLEARDMLRSLHTDILDRQQQLAPFDPAIGGCTSDKNAFSAASIVQRLNAHSTANDCKCEDLMLPYVTLSYAQCLDGSIGSQQHEPVKISCDESMLLTHHIRAAHDAIMVGVGTVVADDPSLTVRLCEGKNPRPVVVDPNVRMPPTAKIIRLAQESGEHVLLLCGTALSNPDPEVQQRVANLKALGSVELVPSLVDEKGFISFIHALDVLYRNHGVRSVMVEGGVRVIESVISQHAFKLFIDSVIVTVSPTAISGARMQGMSYSLGRKAISFSLGEDIILRSRELNSEPSLLMQQSKL